MGGVYYKYKNKQKQNIQKTDFVDMIMCQHNVTGFFLFFFVLFCFFRKPSSGLLTGAKFFSQKIF